MRRYWTLVQHEAFAVRGIHEFARAVQACPVPDGTIEEIQEAGGYVYETHNAALDAADEINWPDGPTDEGHPQAKGTFSTVEISGQAVYIDRGHQLKARDYR